LTRDRSDAKLDPFKRRYTESDDEFAPVRVVDHDRLVCHVDRDGLREEIAATSAASTTGASCCTSAAATAATARARAGARAGAAQGAERG